MAFYGDGANITNNGGYKSMQVFTSSGTWTRPSGITLIKVYVTGGGGGGGGSNGPDTGQRPYQNGGQGGNGVVFIRYHE